MPYRDLAATLEQGLLESLLGGDPEVVAELERRASAGCSVTARLLVDVRETLAELALASSAAARPPPPSGGLASTEASSGTPALHAALRKRILADALSSSPGAGGADDVDAVDPSERVARQHVASEIAGATARDRARRDEVNALDTQTSGSPDPAMDRWIARLSVVLPYRVLLFAVVRGESVVHLATHGVPEALGDFRKVPRQTTFCTHCVSAGQALRVENARAEPFFRGNPMVWKLGAGAYAGVPLFSARGVAIGTVCGLHDQPRRVHDEDVTLLSLFGERVTAHVERVRTPHLEREIVERVSADREVMASWWHRRLLAAVVARQTITPRDPDLRPVGLRVFANDAELAAWHEPGPAIVGRLSSGDLAAVVGSVGPEPGALGVASDADAVALDTEAARGQPVEAAVQAWIEAARLARGSLGPGPAI